MGDLKTAQEFFEACESGKGWDVCKEYCHSDATFAAQARALDGVETIAAYSDWMKDFLVGMPDGRYEIKGFAEDEGRSVALVYGIFSGTLPASGDEPARAFAADYVYAMEFKDSKISHMTKVWNDGYS